MTTNTSDLFKQQAMAMAISLPIGIATGIATTVFGKGLLLVTRLRQEHLSFFVPLLAFAGLASVFLYRWLGKGMDLGMPLVFQVANNESDTIPKRMLPMVMMAAWTTHLFGGSSGRVGIATQIGASIAHQLSRKCSTPLSPDVLMRIGIAAGFAGIFRTPLAGAFFALEILIVGRIAYTALLPTFFAAGTAAITSQWLGLEHFTFPLAYQEPFTLMLLAKMTVVGVLFALIGNFFALALRYTRQKLPLLLPNPYTRVFCTGLLISVLLLICHSGRYAGLGSNLIQDSLMGKGIYPYDWLLKLMLTCLTLACGFQGSEITPLFAIGASGGAILSVLIGLPLELTVALGMIAVFSSATNTRLAPILIGCEFFGYSNLPYFILISLIAYSLYRPISIYPLQRQK